MVTKIGNVIDAYTNAGKAVGGIAARDGGGSFADVLKSSVEQFTSTQKASDSVAAQAVAGKANMVDVATAISNAEVTLEAVVAVRDRIVQAYQEIMRMPI
jgi:flagellar hook-basal body complex protein FliE